jgi:hexosaminidase
MNALMSPGNRFAYLLFCVLGSALSPAFGVQPSSIVPQPAKIEWKGGSFTLSESCRVLYSGAAARAEAETLAALLRPASGFRLPVAEASSPASSGNIVLTLKPDQDSALGKEGYTLEVESGGVRITAPTAAGLFYGGQTLRQLLPPAIFSTQPQTGLRWEIPACKIDDQPRFAWRAFMLDYSRHFSDIATTKRLLDAMAMHKLNLLHMHLADDEGWRIEIKQYPKLTEVGAWRGTKAALPNPPYLKAEAGNERYGGFFTQAEIKELVTYAAARHINLMPELDLPGHSLAICTAYPETAPSKIPEDVKSAQGFKGNAISPAKEANYTMVDNIMGELAALFPFDYIHIGGDEVNHALWKACPEIQDLIQREKLGGEGGAQVYFTKRLEGILAKHRKKMIGWNEILNDHLQRTTAILSWVGPGPGYDAARQGFPVVMAPGPHCYFDMSYPSANDEPPGHSWAGTIDAARCYAFDPLGNPGLNPAQATNIFGVQACLWSEFIFPCTSKSGWQEWPTMWDAIGFKAFPRLCALAEMGWTPQNLRSYPAFADRLGVHYLRMKSAGIPFRLPPPEAEVRQGLIQIIPPYADAMVRYTLDGTDPFRSATTQLWNGKPLEGQPAQLRARTFLGTLPSPLHVGARPEAFAAVSTSIGHYGEDHAPDKLADNDPKTFFWSDRPVHKGECVTIIFKQAVSVTQLVSRSGMPNNSRRDILAQGELAVSEDGATFRKLADFDQGVAKADFPQPAALKAVRITCTADQSTWLILQDLVLR